MFPETTPQPRACQGALGLKARDVMTTTIQALHPLLSLQETARLFEAKRISAAPILDRNQRLLGLVTKSDLVHYLAHRPQNRPPGKLGKGPLRLGVPTAPKGEGEEALACPPGRDCSTPITEIMVEDLLCVDPDASLAELAQSMTQARVHHLLVARGDTFLGLITSMDLVRILSQVLEEAKDDLS